MDPDGQIKAERVNNRSEAGQTANDRKVRGIYGAKAGDCKEQSKTIGPAWFATRAGLNYVGNRRKTV